MSHRSSPTPLIDQDPPNMSAKEPDFLQLQLPDNGQHIDLEAINDAHLMNSDVKSFAWQGITVTVKDRETKQMKAILNGIDGIVEAGEICALMGPSGSGKTTLLNVLAHRDTPGAKLEGESYVNGSIASVSQFRAMSSYVEQDDALIGSLTVRETMHFAARLAHKNSLTKSERIKRIDSLLDSFGLRNQANTLIGTPIHKGISGGQKRRVSVASQLITSPKLLFLDEPTSGLDSSASYEVISFIKKVAKRNNLIVIASIHQPSSSTFQLFDKLMLLSGGKNHYFGTVEGINSHFENLGLPIPSHTNPAEFVIELLNTDFASDVVDAQLCLEKIEQGWNKSPESQNLKDRIERVNAAKEPLPVVNSPKRHFPIVLMTLIHRAFIKSYRDVVAYGVRIAMYIGLAIMMGTVWLRLPTTQSSIQPFSNAIFFGSAFMSFMAVAYIPAFLEDRLTFIKERQNGLYGAAALVISNFIIGIPYLFLITILFAVPSYWFVNFQPTATAFFMYIMWLFLDLLAAESLVVLISSIFPNFVIALALTAFANGLWMSVGGFLVPPTVLNVFWKYVFHYIDYQSYVFQGMMVNEFSDRIYDCGEGCHCMYNTALSSQCKIDGKGVLAVYDYPTGRTGKWVGILLAIIFGYRVLAWAVLAMRR